MRHLSADVLSTIRRMAADGHRDKDIAAHLGDGYTAVGIGSIRKRRQIRGGQLVRAQFIVDRPVAPEVLEELDEGAVLRLMAGDTGIPLRRYRPGTRGVPLSPEAVEAIRRLARRGLDDHDISEALHRRLSGDAVLKARQRHGIAAGWWRKTGVAA